MSKLVLAVLGSIVSISALAQDVAVRMSREELLFLLPGAKVIHFSSAGSKRQWTNQPDGTLYATTDNKQFGSLSGIQTAGQAGTWKVSDEGKYCIDIDWKKVSEKWCANILRGEGDTYYLNKVDESRKIIFAK